MMSAFLLTPGFLTTKFVSDELSELQRMGALVFKGKINCDRKQSKPTRANDHKALLVLLLVRLGVVLEFSHKTSTVGPPARDSRDGWALLRFSDNVMWRHHVPLTIVS
jgi:hypothetical protein